MSNIETEDQRQKRFWTWYRIFNGQNLYFDWFPEVKVTAELVDNICNQLSEMKGNRNIFFLPGDRDRELWYTCFPEKEERERLFREKCPPWCSGEDPNSKEKRKQWEDFYKTWDFRGTGSHHDDYIIGSLTNIDRNIVGYIDPKIPDAHVQIQIEDRFNALPLRAYGLHVGLDCDFTKFKPYKEPVDYKQKFEIESCKVKGLFFRELENPNHFDFSMSNYYGLRSLSMFIYVPGRAYY